jgi:hypothetical protein
MCGEVGGLSRRTALIGLAIVTAAAAARAMDRPNAYVSWKNGPPKDPNYFPIAVWLQAPKNAPKYKAAGINLFVGLWKGPTERQLAELTSAGMQVICAQNAVGRKHVDDATIVGWMHGDEPDNAQRRKDGKGYGPPIEPEKVVADYRKMRAADPSRPVLLNLGQGVAWDGWIGRGVRTNHPEDYAEYVRGCDVASFDIYPAVSTRPQVAGKLWYVARGVDRLVKWAGGKRIVWNCIECTRISNVKVKPTPHQVRAEVWMSLIHGSRGLIYFVHQFKPTFIEPALLHDAEMLAAVTKINRRIHALAPVLNGPTVAGGAAVTSSSPDAPVDVMVKRHGGATYLFAVCMRGAAATASFTVTPPAGKAAEVLGEGRTIALTGGTFRDEFKPYDVHLYRIR